MALSDTSVCNMALARIGAKRVNNIDETNTEVNAIHCRLHYGQTRDALLRSHWWRFAVGRASLAEDTDTPDFEWDHQYILPTDFLRFVSLYDTSASFEIEGQRLLTNDDSVDLLYIKEITDPTKFDSLFVEVLVLQLALKLVMPISQDKVLRRELFEELAQKLSEARRVNMDERNNISRVDLDTWNGVRTSSDGTPGNVVP